MERAATVSLIKSPDISLVFYVFTARFVFPSWHRPQMHLIRYTILVFCITRDTLNLNGLACDGLIERCAFVLKVTLGASATSVITVRHVI